MHKSFLLILFFSSIFSNEFVVKRVSQKHKKSRAQLREKIAQRVGDMLNCSCACIHQQIQKFSKKTDAKTSIHIIDMIAAIQKELLSLMRELLEQDKKWMKASSDELKNILKMFDVLHNEMLDDHDSSWWKKKLRLIHDRISNAPLPSGLKAVGYSATENK